MFVVTMIDTQNRVSITAFSMSHPHRFQTTRWSLVLEAGRASSPRARAALEDLCRMYWYPLYAFVRREGVSRDEAEDLTQGFFASILERDDLKTVDPERGRFRAFLRTAMKHFLLNHRRTERAGKRGGGRTVLSLNYDSAEARFACEPAEQFTPEKLFDRQWALTVLDLALDSLGGQYRASGKERLFVALKPHLTGDDERMPYAEIAGQLELTEGAVRTAAHRLRKDFRESLRAQVAETLDESAEPDEEIRLLFEALSGGSHRR